MSKTIDAVPAATVPINQADEFVIWQSGATKKVALSNLLGRATVSQVTNVNTNVTCNGASGVITTQTATTASNAAETGFTISNSSVSTASVILARVIGYSGTYATNGWPDVEVDTTPSAGSFHVKIVNRHSANALNGTMKIHFAVL